MLILVKLGQIAKELLRVHGIDGTTTTDREPGRFEPASESHKAAIAKAPATGTGTEMPGATNGAALTSLAGGPAAHSSSEARRGGGVETSSSQPPQFEKTELRKSPVLSRRGVEGPAFHELQDEER